MPGTGDSYVFATLEAGGVVDVALSSDQTLLYAAMINGDVNVYDLVTRQKIATWHVGTQLGGLSLSADGSFLLATERQGPIDVAILYRVDTATGSATTVTMPGQAFRDVEIVDGDTAILTGSSYRTGPYNVGSQTLYDLTSGQFSPLAGGVYYHGWGTVLAEDKHLTLFAEPGISNGPMFLFDDRTNSIVAYGDNYQTMNVHGHGYYTGFNFGSQAISEAAGRVLQFIGRYIHIYDLGLKYLSTVPVRGLVDGIVFDPTGTYAYVYEIEVGYLTKYHVASWAKVDEIFVGLSQWHNDLGYGNQLLISDDGTRITIVDTNNDIGKLRIVDLAVRNEIFDGSVGADSFAGGKGDDVYLVDHAGDTILELAHEGADEVRTGLASYTLAANVERLTGISASGQSLQGNSSANAIDGGSGDDSIRGEDGDDRLSGHGGNDELRGGRGVDSFDGGDNDAPPFAEDGYGDKVSFYERAATQGAVADLRTGIISNDGFGNRETMTNVESLGGGTAFIDTFYGDGSTNALSGAFGDYLYGLGGHDYIYVSGAPALADGGVGDDLLVLSSAGGALLADSDGDGLAEIAAAMSTGWIVDLARGYLIDGYGNRGAVNGFEAVFGSDLDDTIVGDDLDNVLKGGGGFDQLYGGGGDDQLFGDDVDDYFRGGAGTDFFDGGADDSAYGDRISFSEREATQGVVADLRSGIISNDGFGNVESMINIESLGGGTAFVDTLFGNDARNWLFGGLGDKLYGFGDGDHIQVTSAAAVIDGGDGVDLLRTSSDIANYLPDGNGDGLSDLAPLMTVGYTVDLVAGTIRDGFGNVGTVAGIENIAGSRLADDLRGDSGNNRIESDSGNDLLRLYDGGDDIVYAGAGNDNIFFIGSLSSADVINGGEGLDTVIIQGGYGALALSANITQIENVSLLGGNNTNFGEPGTNRYDYVLTTNDANFAAGVQARINGAALLAGEDFTFDGSAETDAKYVVYGGKGRDTLTGGLGNDIFFYAEERFASGDVVNGGAGYDGMFLRGNYTIDFTAPGYTGLFTSIENLTLTSATDERYARGGGTEFDYNLTLSDAIVKPGEQLTISGTLLMASESMILDGSQEADGLLRLFGGKAGDTLKGGGQNDLLHGNLGADILAGNGGSDSFRYQEVAESDAANMDQILDFTPGADKIELDRIDANTLIGGDQGFAWIGSNAFSGQAGQLRAYQQGGTWIVEGDVNGDSVADLVIALTLQGPTPLGAADFLL